MPKAPEYKEAEKVLDLRGKPIEEKPQSTIRLPKAQYRYLVLRSIAGPQGIAQEFQPPEEFTKTKSGLIIPGSVESIHPQNWCSHIFEIVDIGEGVKDAKDPHGTNVGEKLRVGQWVVTASVSMFSWLGIAYATCSPEYLSAIVKEPEEDAAELIKQWVAQWHETAEKDIV